jgi:hypothetical protein
MRFEFLDSFEKALPMLGIIFLVVFSIILLARLILTFLLNNAVKHYHNLKNSDKFFKKNDQKFIKEEEEKLREKKEFKEVPRAHSAMMAEMKAKENKQQSGSYELIPSEQQELDREQLNEINIVDIVKPIGFWTSMILGQKLTYLIQAANIIKERDKKGFWVSMIEAKDRAAGKQRGR